jgi:uncharacterized Ntn-hydrolase superfamily protein
MTFAITGRCEKTGMLGIAICTAVPCVGAMTNYIKPQIGAMTVTALVDPYLGFEGLKMLENEKSPEEIKEFLTQNFRDIQKRQFAILDKFGNAAAFTGSECIDTKQNICKKNVVVTANMMVDDTTGFKMMESFEANVDLPLDERLLKALEAGNATPGDYRGRQSASLQVFYKDDFPYRSIRVDEHKTPVEELRRIFELNKKILFPYLGWHE